MLRWTSCLFALVVLHAYYAQDIIYHHVYLTLTVTSLLIYTGQRSVSSQWIKLIDSCVAHAAVAIAIIRAPAWIYEIFPMLVIGLWVSQSFVSRERANQLHFLLHLVAVIGMHFFLAASAA